MPTDSDPSSQRHFIHLDMLRGLCALGVVVGHLRGFLLVDFGSLHTPSLADRMLYFFAGLGHQSVLAFFALSGFLVGGKALTAIVAGTWSWGAYLVARLTRLWTVVVPALIVTLALDRTGTWLTAGNGYDGAYFRILASGPGILNPADNSFTTLLANIAFLQTIASPVFGTNGPLWSLANEFWYYVVFPLAAWTFSRNAPRTWICSSPRATTSPA